VLGDRASRGGRDRAARHDDQRFRRFVRGLAVLGAMGLDPDGDGTRRFYWFWKPLQGQGEFIFGPFINRDHFGFYMLMVSIVSTECSPRHTDATECTLARGPICAAMIALSGPAGISLMYSSVPALTAVKKQKKKKKKKKKKIKKILKKKT
jgi:hypothetical protein